MPCDGSGSRGSGAFGAGAGRHVARKSHYGHLALVDGVLQCGRQHPRELRGSDGHLVVTAAIVEKTDRIGLLEIARAELIRRAGRSDGQHGAVAPVGVVESVDQVDVPRTAAARATGNAVEFGFGRSRESPALLVAHVDPPDGSGATHGVVDFVQAVARHGVDAADTRPANGFDQLVGYFLSHNIGIFNCLHRPVSVQDQYQSRRKKFRPQRIRALRTEWCPERVYRVTRSPSERRR